MREYRQLGPRGVPGVKKDGKWWRHVMTGKGYVPERLRAKVVFNFHYGTSGHAGVLKTRKRVASMFYWPGLAEDVARVVGPMQLERQNWWLLVVMDHATRYMGTWIPSTVTAAQTAHIFLQGWVTPFGIPAQARASGGRSMRWWLARWAASI
ncbi:hypothetical protein GNI_052820 [Gregarina niphandrodes]|uniref:Integrase zinc-binding domain-containing protein n=1 Tax=Gregarina niphandrodes TaxID=110365 RepID=A0A023B947_GRENI|nr:hypothetical protein GNI_052820 [Gregarina niphandrodes]EZG71322.1 hypothetical protein GNI_052820 [Gregarina niphandrodes]|eukprot:XP_011129829.1 hypothetical protein GNI_052820 [Gregarina niphandrodes]